jgi:cytochrome c-type biogenesis protein CcmE
MNPKRKQRLILILLGVCGLSVAVFLVIFALRQNLNYFFTPLEISSGAAPSEQVIRAGGMVLPGSIEREDGSLVVNFKVTDYAATIDVQYDGILPDLFAEGQGVVVIGQLNDRGLFTAESVLAKHDESYMPPEVTHALEQAEEAAK